jgi:hypothetical protein
VMALSLSPYVLQSPWNPFLTVFPFALFVISTWATRMNISFAPLCLLTGTFLAQSHVGFVPLVGALWLWAAWRLRSERPQRKVWIASIAILAVCWLPVLFDEMFGRHNLETMSSFFLSSELPKVGILNALGIVAREIMPIAPWMTGREPLAPGGIAKLPLVTLLIPTGFFAAAWRVARKHENRNALLLLGTVGVAATAGTFCVSRITEEAAYYLVRFWWPLAAVFWVSIAWSLLSWVRTERATRAAITVALSISVIAGMPLLYGNWRPDVPTPNVQAPLAATLPAAVAHAGSVDRIYLEGRGINGGWFADALSLHLTQQGVDIVLADFQRYKAGDHRIGTPENAGSHLIYAAGAQAIAETEAQGARRLAGWQPPADWRPDDRFMIRLIEGPPAEPIGLYVAP